MGGLTIVDTGILFINPDPSRFHVWAATAHPIALSDTELVATYQRGAAMYAADSDMAVTRSHDGGVTWAHERFIHDRKGDDRPYSYHDAQLGRMNDGTLVALAFRIDRTDPDQPMFSQSGGLLPVECVLFSSVDNGVTWQGPRVLELPGGMNLTPACPIIELQDGRWLATFDRFKHFDDLEPYRPLMVGFFSSDRGETWGDMVVVADGAPAGKGFWHGRTIALHDGRLFTMFWAADMTNEAAGPLNLPNHVSIASADGREWPMPLPVDLPGQTNYPAQLPDGRLAAVYTWREADRPGTMVALSEDDGRTWNVEDQVRLWDATGWTHLGINQADKYPNSHDTIAFGAPTLHTLPDGDLYATWWCTLASITHIRWARLRAE